MTKLECSVTNCVHNADRMLLQELHPGGRPQGVRSGGHLLREL